MAASKKSALIGAPRMPLQSECLNLFGNPFGHGWEEKHLVKVPPPFPMLMGDLHVPFIRINKIAAESLSRVLDRIFELCGHDAKAIAAGHCNCFSGSFALRTMRGLSTVSMHAYGLAIDFDAPRNPLGAPAAKTFFKPEAVLVRAFEEAGWTWGGRWKGRRDAMHVQYARVG